MLVQDLERHLMLLRVEGLGTRAVTSIKRSSTSHLLVKDPSQPSAKVRAGQPAGPLLPFGPSYLSNSWYRRS